jgi:CheY-like chemotaxis protein
LKTEKLTAAHFELQQAIEEVYFNYKVLALHKRTDFYLMGDLVSHLCVKGSSHQLQQLLHVVFEHTLLFSGATRISLTTKQLLQTQSDVLIEFCLEDNGPNLRNNARGFTYYRALATAKEMIANMKGKSEVMSVPGISTTVKFVIRYELYKTEEVTSAYSCSQLKNKRILIAEDNEVNQKAVAAILEKHGIAFDIANHGKDAIEQFERNRDRYDLIIMDLQMPFMDGIQATNYIRKKLKSDVPVIALTAGSSGSSAADCFEVGINYYIRKPFKPHELIGHIHHALIGELTIQPSLQHSKIA